MIVLDLGVQEECAISTWGLQNIKSQCDWHKNVPGREVKMGEWEGSWAWGSQVRQEFAHHVQELYFILGELGYCFKCGGGGNEEKFHIITFQLVLCTFVVHLNSTGKAIPLKRQLDHVMFLLSMSNSSPFSPV